MRCVALLLVVALSGGCGSTDDSGTASTGANGGNGGGSGVGAAGGVAGGTGGNGAIWAPPKCDTAAPPHGAVVHGECNAEGWCFENPLPRTLHVRSIWGFANDDIWVGALEGVYHQDGTTWSRVSSTVGALWGSAPDDIWQVNDDGIIHYDGKAWAPVSNIAPVRQIHGSGPDDVWAVGASGLAAHYDATGWHTVTPFTTEDLGVVWAAAPGDVWFSGLPGVAGDLFHKVGATTTAVTPAGWSSVTAIWSASPTDVWIGGGTSGGWGRLAHFDGSAIAEVSLAPGMGRITAIWGLGANDVWIACGAQLVHWDGASLVEVASPVTSPLVRVWGASNSDVWAATDDFGRLVHFDGDAWKLPGIPIEHFQAVWGGASNDLWAAGSPGASVHYDGNAWTVVPVPTTAPLAAITGSAGEVYAVDGDGQLFLDTGGGWTAVANAATSLTDAQAVAPGKVLVAGDAYVGLFDNGVLTPLPAYYGSIQSVWASGPNDIWVAGHGDVGHWDGTQWNDVSLAQATTQGGFSHVIGLAPNDVYLMNYFDVFRFDGSGWSAVSGVPSNPTDLWACDASVWVAGTFGEIGRILGTSVVQSYDAEAIVSAVWAASPTHLVVVGSDGSIARLAK